MSEEEIIEYFEQFLEIHKKYKYTIKAKTETTTKQVLKRSIRVD